MLKWKDVLHFVVSDKIVKDTSSYKSSYKRKIMFNKHSLLSVKIGLPYLYLTMIFRNQII